MKSDFINDVGPCFPPRSEDNDGLIIEDDERTTNMRDVAIWLAPIIKYVREDIEKYRRMGIAVRPHNALMVLDDLIAAIEGTGNRKGELPFSRKWRIGSGIHYAKTLKIVEKKGIYGVSIWPDANGMLTD